MTDSPDENALVAAAHALGYQILSKTPTECVVKVPTQDGKQVRESAVAVADAADCCGKDSPP